LDLGGFNVASYYLDGTSLTPIHSAIFAGVADVSVLPAPLTPNADAEVVAAGTGGTRWYGVYPMGMQPMGLPGGACNFTGGSTKVLCQLASNTNPNDGVVVQGAVLSGKSYAIAIGSSDTADLQLTSGLPITGILVSGDDIAS